MTPEVRANLSRCSTCPRRRLAQCLDGGDVFGNAMGRGCPLKYFPAPVQVAEAAQVDTAKLWDELHRRVNPNAAWFSDWCSRVPATGCSCREGWEKILKMWPPDFGAGWFEWGWRAHNLVNAKIGKPVMSVDAARKLYGR